jgi:uncharacterized caspase-like protein
MSKTDHYAIIVGITTYPDASLKDLRGPVRDAKEFCQWLVDPAGGDMDEQNIKCLLTTDFHPPDPTGPQDAHPIPNEIDALFEKYVSRGLQGRVGERLYVFVAGHGFSDPQDIETNCLYAANARSYFPYSTAITHYASWFYRNAVFDEIVLIMDCCRTTNPMHCVNPPPLPVLQGSARASRVKRFYAFATGWGQETREKDFGGGLWSGIFTDALLKALRNAKPDSQGLVTGMVIKNYVHNVIDSIAGDIAVNPPEIQVDSNRDIIFKESANTAIHSVEIVLETHTGQETLVIYDSTGNELLQETAVNRSVKVDLEPGFYKVVVANTDRKKLFEVPADEEVPV